MLATDTIKPRTISPAELAARGGQGTLVTLIDVRTPVEFAALHAEGARLVPLDTLDPAAVMAGRDASPADPVYLICKSGARAAKAAALFQRAGFDNVCCVEGGTIAWQQAGLPVVRGTVRMISLERQVRIAAGTLVLLGILLALLVHPALLIVSAFVGAGLVFSGITDWCGMGLLLARMPWNKLSCDRTANAAGV